MINKSENNYDDRFGSADKDFEQMMQMLIGSWLTQIAGAVATYSMAGDFFVSVPEADLYLLKHILHDWDDAQAIRILENCRRAMEPGGRVIVVEMLLGEIGESGLAPFSDLNMMVMVTGRERTLAEYRALLKQANLRLAKSSAIRPPMTVLEAVAE